jgi:hypothetical protein
VIIYHNHLTFQKKFCTMFCYRPKRKIIYSPQSRNTFKCIFNVRFIYS